jgi:hypothetical protein
MNKSMSDDHFAVPDLFDSLAEQMWLSLREQLIPHRGEQGAAREAIVRAFLTRYLPKRFSVSSGFVFDHAGRVSKQVDIVVYDALESPCFETAGDKKFFPCEGVVCVGEVKSSLTSERRTYEAFDNILSVRELDRSAGGHNISREAQRGVDHKRIYLDQIFSFLFVSGRVLSESAMRSALGAYLRYKSRHVWPNVVLAFDRYLLTYACPDGTCPNTMHAIGIGSAVRHSRAQLLMRWFLYVAQAISVTTIPAFEYRRYLPVAVLPKASTYFLDPQDGIVAPTFWNRGESDGPGVDTSLDPESAEGD